MLQHGEQGGETQDEVGGWGAGPDRTGSWTQQQGRAGANTLTRGPRRTERQGRCCAWDTKARARMRGPRVPHCSDTALQGNATAPGWGSLGWVLLIPQRRPSVWPSPVTCLCTKLAPQRRGRRCRRASPPLRALPAPPEPPGLRLHQEGPWQWLSLLPFFLWFVCFRGLEASCRVSLEHMKGSAYFPHTVAPRLRPRSSPF